MFSWSLALLILQAGDTELNPGPLSVDPNPVICVICSGKIDRGPNIEGAASCLSDNCYARFHLPCNGLNTAQSCHARSLNKEIQWSCPQHGNGKAKVITPTQATVAPSSSPERERASAARKTCWICNKIIQTRYAASAYHCSIPSSNFIYQN